jgi:hypothetical protein
MSTTTISDRDFHDLVSRVRQDCGDFKPIRLMIDRVRYGIPFCHLRFNDGEALCAWRLREPNEQNNCGHYYMADLGAALRRMLREIAESKTEHIMLGGYWHTQGHRIDQLDEAAQATVSSLGSLMPRMPWVGSDDIVEGLMGPPQSSRHSDKPYTLQLFDAVRHSGRKVHLICNPQNHDGRYCLGAACLTIHRINCWVDTPVVTSYCRAMCEESPDSIWVWCCGMSKPWIWDTWRRYPQTTHLDAGHLFDATFGEYNRAYTRRRNREEEKWRCYEDYFIPYCLSFVPK